MPAAANGENAARLKGDREITITRVFNAPRDLVWEAWTNPAHIEKWWGPDGFTTTTHEHDLRPGGSWRHTMRGPDGVEYPNHSEFVEVVRPARLVYTHGGHREGGGTPVCFRHTVTFEDLGDSTTRVTAHIEFHTAENRDAAVREYGALDGATQHFANLAAYLAVMPAPGVEHLRITREFNAPRALVFRSWTEPELLRKWWGPRGFTLPHCTVDLRVGGEWHYCMRGPDGAEFWGKAVYREIAPPDRLAMTMRFTDAQGARKTPVDIGMPASVPEEMVLVVTFTEHRGRTTVTIDQSIPAHVAREIGAFDGWNSSFDKLAETLA